MKAITLYQPWASWIAYGWKTIETRMHNRFQSLRGERVAIHAGKTWDENAIRVAHDYLRPDQRHRVAKAGCPRGAVLCSAFVVGCRRMLPSDAPFALCPYNGRLYVTVLKNIRPLDKPIPARGSQGVWTWEPP